MVVDLIIIAIILLSTFLAYRKGLVSLAIGLVSFAIAIAVTLILYKPVSNLVINTTSIDETIENAIFEKADDIMTENKEGDDYLVNPLMETAKNNMLPETARTLAVNIVTGGVILILVIAIKIALRFVNALANLVAKLPIIKQVNKAGGIIYGLLRGLIIVYAALLLINVAGQINSDNMVHQNIENSSLGKTMYENNILKILL